MKNRQLIHFQLVHHNLHPKCWKLIGNALAVTPSLNSFTLWGCNIAEGDNLLLLLEGTARNKSLDTTGDSNKSQKSFGTVVDVGLTENQSIETLDISDNDLTDA